MKKFMPKLYHMSEYDDHKDKNIEFNLLWLVLQIWRRNRMYKCG